jgi:hypothetical protein
MVPTVEKIANWSAIGSGYRGTSARQFSAAI